MSDTNQTQSEIQTDNRIVRAEVMHYADLTAKIIRDEIAEVKAHHSRKTRRGLKIKLAALVLGLILTLVALAIGLNIYLSATITGIPAIIVEIVNGMIE